MTELLNTIMLQDNLRSGETYRIRIPYKGFLHSLYLNIGNISIEQPFIELEADLEIGGFKIWNVQLITNHILSLVHEDYDLNVSGKYYLIKPIYQIQSYFTTIQNRLDLANLKYHNIFLNLSFKLNKVLMCTNNVKPSIDSKCTLPISLHAEYTNFQLIQDINMHEIRTLSYHLQYKKYVHTGHICKMRLNVNFWCPAMYIYITDIHNREIPISLIDKITFKINGFNRHELTGFQSKHLNRRYLPHMTKENNQSKNLYYLSFFSSSHVKDGHIRTLRKGFEQEKDAISTNIFPSDQINDTNLSFNRIDTAELSLQFKVNKATKGRIVNIYIVYQAYNWIRYFNHTMFMLYDHTIDPEISHTHDDELWENELIKEYKQVYSDIITEIKYLAE